MTLAKLNGKEKMVEVEVVIKAAINKGASMRIISLGRRVRERTKTPINTIVVAPAWINDPTTVFPASKIEIEEPVACGAIC